MTTDEQLSDISSLSTGTAYDRLFNPKESGKSYIATQLDIDLSQNSFEILVEKNTIIIDMKQNVLEIEIYEQ